MFLNLCVIIIASVSIWFTVQACETPNPATGYIVIELNKPAYTPGDRERMQVFSAKISNKTQELLENCQISIKDKKGTPYHICKPFDLRPESLQEYTLILPSIKDMTIRPCVMVCSYTDGKWVSRNFSNMARPSLFSFRLSMTLRST